VDTIIQGNSPNKDPELTDIKTPDPSYNPARTINVAGDIVRDMQKQFSEQLADKAQKVEVESLTTTVEGLQSTVDTKAAISYVDTQVATRATTGYVDDAVASV